MMREEYTSPVGFASEPAEQRKHWVARIITALLLVFIVWLAVTKVFTSPTDPSFRNPAPVESSLPGPV